MGTTITPRPATGRPAPAVDVIPVTFEVLAGAAVEKMIPEWDACAAAADNPFQQSPWFATTVWNFDVSRRGDLCVVAGRDDAGALCAVFPLWISRSRMPVVGLSTLQPLTLFGQETSSIVVGAADRAGSTAAVADFLLTTDTLGHDVLHLPAIDPGSELFLALCDAAQRHGLPFLRGGPATTAVIRPSRSGPQLLSGPSARFRRNLRRAWRRAHASGSEVVCREISWEWQTHQAAIAQIDRARWGEVAAGTTFALHEEGASQAVEAMLSRLDRYFRAHAFAAFVDGEVAAHVIAFRAGTQVHLWSAGLDERFRPLCAGMLLWDHCLHELASWPGVEQITFGRGAERFKLDWSDGVYSVCELAVVRAAGLRRRRALVRLAHLSPGSGGQELAD